MKFGARAYWRSWARIFERPEVLALRQRFAPQIAFVRARLSPGGYLGLYLTIGIIFLVGASWFFGGIAQDVVAGDPLTLVDAEVAQWLHAHVTPALIQFMKVISDLHGVVAISILTAAAAAMLVSRREWYWLLGLILSVPGGMVLNLLSKSAFQRPRPQWEHPVLTLETFSFPSGHVAGATAWYGFVALFLIARTRSWSRRVWIMAVGLLLVFLVALSRMYLGVHYLSDVLAAFAEGVAWLALCLTGVHTFRLRRKAQSEVR